MQTLGQLLRDKLNATHEGARAVSVSPENQVLRMTLANMLWEDSFYVDGQESASLLKQAVAKADPRVVADIARAARKQYKLRHVPLFLMRELASRKAMLASDLAEVIDRPDELGEFLAIYWKDGKQPLANQVKKGLAEALCKFNEYQLAKWDKNSAKITIRDVLFLTHAKPKNEAQAILFNKIANKQLETPDTWETNLSAGADKAETFRRLMAERKLGALAFLRNLRGMQEAGITVGELEAYADVVNTDRVLPFRFLAAKNAVPALAKMLERMMLRSLKQHAKFSGRTALVVDVSGSMFGAATVSSKSDLNRFDAAGALAMLFKEVCSEVDIFSFSTSLVEVKAGRGFKLVEDIRDSQQHGGTYLGGALEQLKRLRRNYDRVVVFTDEQSHDRVAAPPAARGYIINVAAYQHGVGFGEWNTVTGFSEAVVDYIQALEQNQL